VSFVFLMLVMLLAMAPASRPALAADPEPVAPQSDDEAKKKLLDIKANLIRTFVSYIEWPPDRLEKKTSPIIIGVVGKDPFGRILDGAFKGKKYGDHPIVVRRYSNTKKLSECHILFVPETEVKSLKGILAAVKDKHVLLIGDSKDFAIKGGIINFYLEKTKGKRGEESVRVKFEINADQAKKEEIKISSKILKLARPVKRKKGERS